MARLNEPPQPSVESIDACTLHQYFASHTLTRHSETPLRPSKSGDCKVRCRYELAGTLSDQSRANSTQSLRIRTLESEVTRLLSENVSLREQMIKIRYETEKSTGRAVLEYVDNMKGKFEAKLAELGGLVEELGNVKKNVDTQRAQRRKSVMRSSPKRSPDQRNWKNALTLSEVTGGADGRLPPIVEDKYFPRRTMEYVILRVLCPDVNIYTVRKSCLIYLRNQRTLLIHLTLGRHLSRTSRKEIPSNLTSYKTNHLPKDPLKVSKKCSQSFRPILKLGRRDGRARIEEIWT